MSKSRESKCTATPLAAKEKKSDGGGQRTGADEAWKRNGGTGGYWPLPFPPPANDLDPLPSRIHRCCSQPVAVNIYIAPE